MSKERIIEIVAAIIVVLMCVFAPDVNAMMFVLVMSAVTFLGIFLGVRSAIIIANGFSVGLMRIRECEKMDIVDNQRWLQIRKVEHMFDCYILDNMFNTYRTAVEKAMHRNTQTIPDIVDYMNETLLETKMRHDVVNQIPGALTGIGILGTFVGLIFGVSGIAFSSVDVAIVSVSGVLSGIKIAFYSSICGVAMSLLFTFVYNWFYNRMLEQYYRFVELFHREVISSTEDQLEEMNACFQQKVLQYLELCAQDKGK